jgi:FkbM family methyltransferase|tara:strand:+ start:152 stop:844 length:693 start_codon:yes stop_codon:yes gene_type:complete
MKKLINYIISKILFIFKDKVPQLKDVNSFLNNVSGVIHIGANSGQEREEYNLYSLDVIWIEPIPKVFKKLKKNIKRYPKQKAYKYLLTNIDNQNINFKIANNAGQSSSILELNQHKDIWPKVEYTRSIKLKSSTLKNVIKHEKIDIKRYQALIIDTQGSELLVLKGGSNLLKNFRYIKTEAADFESYKECCLIKDLSKFLDKFGFKEIKKVKFATRKEGGSYFDILYKRK